MWVGLGIIFVLVPVATYAATLPDYSRYAAGCGQLLSPEDKYNVMVPLGPQQQGPESIEILDPLCPACRGFEQRLQASGLSEQIRRKAVLFPLDDTCNWMVEQAVHPGACAVSEAILCAEDRATEVMEWAFTEQENIRQLAATQPKAVHQRIVNAFPQLSQCLGKPAVKARLNKSLRWIVQQNLPVLTPQLFVNGKKLCDEDSDLGLDYTLSRMLSQH